MGDRGGEGDGLLLLLLEEAAAAAGFDSGESGALPDCFGGIVIYCRISIMCKMTLVDVYCIEVQCAIGLSASQESKQKDRYAMKTSSKEVKK